MTRADNTCRFLNLPVEIRLNIYSEIEPMNPLEYPTNWLRGLQDTCKFIRNEIQSEMLMNTARSIETIALKIWEHGGEITYTPPTTVIGWQNLTVSRPKTAHMFTEGDPFLDFGRLHFQSLRVTFYNHEGYKERSLNPMRSTYSIAAKNLSRTIHRWNKEGHPPALGYWILDWSTSPHRNYLFSTWGDGHSDWNIDAWKDKDRRSTGVCFYKGPAVVPRCG